MKLKLWLLSTLAPLTAIAVLAQDPTPPATENPARAPRPRAPLVKTKIALNPPAPATVTVKSGMINVRGQASFTGEILGHLKKGDAVTVFNEITLSHPRKGEPAKWAEIGLPTGIPVWVDAEYIAADTKTVKARRVNLRGGPGENFSVLGRLEKGAAVKEVKEENGWVAIEPPTNAYAYVAMGLLEMQSAAAAVIASTTPPATTPPTIPPEAPQVVNLAPTTPPAAAQEPPVSEIVPLDTATPPTTGAGATTPADTAKEVAALREATAALAATDTNAPVTPRIVTREGFVHKAYNIQAPADYELRDVQSGEVIDYLQPQPGQNFKKMVGARVTVTGPEEVTPRWSRVPILVVQQVNLVAP